MIHAVYYDKGKNILKSNVAGDYTPWELKFIYDECPFLETNKIDQKYLIYNDISIVSYIKWCIDNERYIHTEMNVAK